MIDVDWHPYAHRASAYDHLADLAAVLEKRSLAWFDEFNMEEHERFVAELEDDAESSARSRSRFARSDPPD